MDSEVYLGVDPADPERIWRLIQSDLLLDFPVSPYFDDCFDDWGEMGRGR